MNNLNPTALNLWVVGACAGFWWVGTPAGAVIGLGVAATLTLVVSLLSR